MWSAGCLATDRWEKRAGSSPKWAAPDDFLQRSGHLGNIRPEILDRQRAQRPVGVQLCQCLIDSGQQCCRVGALADGDGDLLHIVGIGRNFDVGFGMGFLILFPD